MRDTVGAPTNRERDDGGCTTCRTDGACNASLIVRIGRCGWVLAQVGQYDSLADWQGTQRLHEVVVKVGLASTLDERHLVCVDDGEVAWSGLLGRAGWLGHDYLSLSEDFPDTHYAIVTIGLSQHATERI